MTSSETNWLDDKFPMHREEIELEVPKRHHEHITPTCDLSEWESQGGTRVPARSMPRSVQRVD